MLVCLVHGYILFLKLRHMCDGLVKFDPLVDNVWKETDIRSGVILVDSTMYTTAYDARIT